ncbi:thiamine phosphate synthase [Marinifilum sp.]|uniref:thiamine phosphate synthase n=1 Tax=Marinifilum sp. TaxID=2033137 RepID=UPI003BA8F633
MELILLSYPDFFKGETEIVSSLLDHYEFTFHLRKPNATERDLVDYLNEIPEAIHPKIVLHNKVEVFTKFNLKGMHFSGTKRKKALQLDTDVCKGTSCHSISEIKSLGKTFDYVYLSPIFESISKQGYQGNLNLKEVKKFLNESKQTQVYALGGIAAYNIKQLKDYPFDGFAVLGAVWTNDPLKNRNMIQSNFKEINSIMQTEYAKSNS